MKSENRKRELALMRVAYKEHHKIEVNDRLTMIYYPHIDWVVLLIYSVMGVDTVSMNAGQLEEQIKKNIKERENENSLH